MSVFDIENLNPGTWFTLPDGGRVCLRVCAGDDFRNIRSQTHKQVVMFKVNPVTRVNERITYEEELDKTGKQFNNLLWDFCIVDWENFFDKNENPIPCNTENKLLLMNHSTRFSKFVTESIAKITEMDAQSEEIERKNS